MGLKSELLTVLTERGFVKQCTDVDALDALAFSGPVTGYIGFDLTADSLHVGSLIQIMVLRWMQKLGHRPLVLLGEATTRIGDPTGKTSARPMLGSKDIENNRRGIARVFENMLPDAEHVSNWDWLNNHSGLFSYLTEYGPHFSINRMVAFDSVRRRLDENQSMSFLEFNYMLFQAIDFLNLFEREGCRLQIGGSDQWGNIVNGVELTRRKLGVEVFGLTTPLMTNTAGEKMGKTATGAVWLSADKTSPHDFWQFWRNVEDAKVEEFLKLFTDLPLSAVAEVAGGNINDAKKTLADEVTRMVHGGAAAKEARLKAVALYERGDLTAATEQEVQRRPAITLADILLETGLVKSKGEADRLVANRGVRIDGVLVDSVRDIIPPTMFAEPFTLSVGKKNMIRIKLVGDQ